MQLLLLLFLHCIILCHTFNPSFKAILNPDGSATHASITRCALATVTSEYLKARFNIAITLPTITKGICPSSLLSQIENAFKLAKYIGGSTYSRWENMVDEIVDHNEYVDVLEQFDSSRHFDSESFVAGSDIIRSRLQLAINSLNANDYESSNERFGKLTHTLQDFYAHSNWIELNNTEPQRDLGNKTLTTSQFAARSVRTCSNCAGGTDAVCRGNNVVSSGLTSGYYIFGADIFTRKPTGKCSHGGSTDASRNNDAIGGINKDSLSSIHGYLHVKAAQTAYLATCKILGEFRTRVGDAAFGKFLNILSRQASTSRSFAGSTFENVNHQSPLIYTTILNNLRKAESFSIVRQVVALPAMDSVYKAHILSIARRRHIPIDIFRADKFVQQSFDFGQDLARLTGGLYAIYSDEKQVDNMVIPNERTELIDVFYAAQSSDVLMIKIDQTCSSLLLEFFSNDTIPMIHIKLQNGYQRIYPSSIVTDTTYYRSYRFLNPQVGQWQLVLSEAEGFLFDLHVSCSSDFRCFSRVFVDNGNSAHPGQAELQGNLIEQQNALLMSTCDSNVIEMQTMTVTMIDTLTDDQLSSPMLSIYDSDNNRWMTNMTSIPSKLFRLKFSINNGAIERLSRASFQPSLVDVEIYQLQTEQDNSTVIKYRVINFHQIPVKIRFIAKNIGTFVVIREYQMQAGETRNDQVEFNPDQQQSSMTSEMIALTVISQLGDWNYDVVSL